MSIVKKSIELDETDLKILTLLSKDSKISYAEIGKKLFVSAGTVHVRIKKLTDHKFIKAHRIEIDYQVLGYDITAFLGIYLEKSNLYDGIKQELKKIPEIVDAHYTTGNYSIFAKVICKDTAHLRDIIGHKIQSIPGIHRTETFISLEETLSRPFYLSDVE